MIGVICFVIGMAIGAMFATFFISLCAVAKNNNTFIYEDSGVENGNQNKLERER